MFNNYFYSTNKKSFGQLGFGDVDNRLFPMNLKFLNTLKACYIACGEEFTAVLTLDGGVFTFGAGMYGQLGHNSTSHEYLPRKVPDLMGSEVTQIACGRCHTLVYLSSNRFYSFGLGGNGQLGSGAANLNKLMPSPVKVSLSNVKNLIPLNNSSNSTSLSYSKSEKSELCLYSISAGGDQSFIITYPVRIFLLLLLLKFYSSLKSRS